VVVGDCENFSREVLLCDSVSKGDAKVGIALSTLRRFH
jgi:hypothetical protein